MDLKHTEKLMLRNGLTLFEFKAINIDEIPIFAFLIVDENDILRLQHDLAMKPIVDYKDYGRYIFSGTGTPTDLDREIAHLAAEQMLSN